MNVAADLLSETRALGIAVTARGDKLHLAAPAGTLTAELRARLAANKTTLMDLVSVPDHRARLLAAIRAERLPDAVLGGADATAEKLAELDAAGLRAYAVALYATAERLAGRVPPAWDHVAHCDGCGPVYLFSPGTVSACPWCWNRRALRPIPRPKVQCNGCAHFICNPVNPAAGVGTCGAGQPQGRASLWPMAEHVCTMHKPCKD